MINLLMQISFGIFMIFIVFQVIYIFFPLFSVQRNTNFPKLAHEKGMTVLVPAYNEELTIEGCLRGIMNVDYSNFEAIIINDGSSDNTLEQLAHSLKLQPVLKTPANQLMHEEVYSCYQSATCPNIFVLDKKNGGKADALNAGIEYASFDIVITLDADSVLDKNSLAVMNATFENEKVLAAGGMVQIAQGFNGNSLKPKPTFNVPGLIRYQILQYVSEFYLYKTTQAKLGSISVIAGAFGAFKRHALFDVNGFRKTVGEDMDITLRMQLLLRKTYKKHKLVFVPHAICYTECPSTFKDLVNQRIRWQKGFIDCIVNFRKSFFVGLGTSVSIYLMIDSFFLGTIMAFPTILIPIIILFTQNMDIVFFFLALTTLIGLYRTLTSIIIKSRVGHSYSKFDYIRLLLFIPFDVFFYRWLGTFFVILGTFLYMFNKHSWNSVKRVGAHKKAFGEGALIQGKEV